MLLGPSRSCEIIFGGRSKTYTNAFFEQVYNLLAVNSIHLRAEVNTRSVDDKRFDGSKYLISILFKFSK